MATETKTIKPQESAATRFWNWLTETQVWTSVFHQRHAFKNASGSAH